MEYDAIGHISSTKNGRKQETTYRYDQYGRISGFIDDAGKVTYEYDNNGNVLTISETVGEITKTMHRSYDALNRVTSSTDNNGKTVKYAYDEFSNMIYLTYPGGEIVRYQYDLMGRVTDVFYGNAEKSEVLYEYDANWKSFEVFLSKRRARK